MFGKRGGDDGNRFNPEFRQPATAPAAPATANVAETATLARPAVPSASPSRRSVEAPPLAPEPKKVQRERSEAYYDTKSQVFSALIDTIDLSQLAKLDPRHRQRYHRDQEFRDVDLRAGRAARGHLQ
jgi:pilus assembly protein CpaF